jgi:hypothetical protein
MSKCPPYEEPNEKEIKIFQVDWYIKSNDVINKVAFFPSKNYIG